MQPGEWAIQITRCICGRVWYLHPGDTLHVSILTYGDGRGIQCLRHEVTYA